MRWFWKTSTSLLLGGLLLTPPATIAQQKPPAPKATPRPAAPMPAAPQLSPAPAPQVRPRIVIVDPIRVYDPFFDYPYAYPPGYYMSANFGYVKIKTDRKDASVYVDGGFADRIGKTKRFALRPGTHDVEVRDSDNRTLLHEKVAVLVGKTTELRVG